MLHRERAGETRGRRGRQTGWGQRWTQKDGRTTFVAIRKKSRRYSEKKNKLAERHSFCFSFIATPPPLLCLTPNLFKMSPEPPPSPKTPISSTPLFASSRQLQASWNIPLQIVSLRQCCLSFFHHRRGLGHTHLSLWTSCPAPSVHCPLSTHTHTHTATLVLKCGSYWQRRHAREQFLFIGHVSK